MHLVVQNVLAKGQTSDFVPSATCTRGCSGAESATRRDAHGLFVLPPTIIMKGVVHHNFDDALNHSSIMKCDSSIALCFALHPLSVLRVEVAQATSWLSAILSLARRLINAHLTSE